MMYLLDTNVISEWSKPVPDRNVERWSESIAEFATFLSVVTIAEIRSGIVRMPAGARKDQLEIWLHTTIRQAFRGRVLSIDEETADIYGRLFGDTRSRGLNTGVLDIFIAATAIIHGLTVVTRNTRDFEALGVSLVNPWLEQA
jgi:predicted nucleic acid-binding protein